MTSRWLLLSGALAVAALVSWASSGPGSTPPASSSPSREEPRPVAKRATRPVPDVSTLYAEGTSAYHARVFAEGGGLVLVTQAGFTTLLPGKPPARHEASLGPVVALQAGALVFWRSGALRAISLSDAAERELASLPAAPQHLLASEEQLAWIQTDRDAGTTLQTLADGRARIVYRSAESILAAVLRGSDVYWVSGQQDGSWHVQRTGLDGQHNSTRARRGRPPAMLAVGPDGIYFYAGREGGVRRLSFDLEQETAVLANVICSPLAVSSRVVCAQVGGLFDVPRASSAPRFLATERAGPIAAVAASHDRAFWVAEDGEQRLVVRAVTLPEL